MNDEEVRRVLVHAVDDVQAGGLDPFLWDRGRRMRRTRRIVVAAGVLTVGLGVVAALTVLVPPRLDDGVTVARTAKPQPTVQVDGITTRVAPGPRTTSRLPLTRTALAALAAIPGKAAPLARPAVPAAARAVVQTSPDTLLILTVDGRWQSQRVDARTLGLDVPGGGGGAQISPDGLHIALPAGRSVALIDLRTGAVSALRSGSQGHELQYLNWLDDTRLVAGGDTGQVEWSLDGSVTPSAIHAGDVVRGTPTPLQLRPEGLFRSSSGPGGGLRIPLSTPSGLTIDAWYGEAVASGSTVARTAFVNGNDEQAVLLVDLRTGVVTDALRLPYTARSQGCCGVLGWLDGARVVFRDGDVLLAWRTGTGELQRVATLPPGASVTLGPGA